MRRSLLGAVLVVPLLAAGCSDEPGPDPAPTAAALADGLTTADLTAVPWSGTTTPAAVDRAFDLPGGETLQYREMVRRVLRVLDPPARLLELPLPMFEFAVRIAQSRGIATGFGDAAIERMRRDLVFDVAPAREAFGYAPRTFAPKASMFPRRDA